MGANNHLKKVPDDIDGRSKEAQHFRNIVNDTIKLAGNRQPAAVVEQLAKQYAGLVIRQEYHQSRLFGGDGRGHGSDAAYVKLVNSSNRCLRLLGLTQIKDGEDDGDVNALEKYCTTRTAELGAKKSKRRRDRRRERLGK